MIFHFSRTEITICQTIAEKVFIPQEDELAGEWRKKTVE
jgi:hypothetical protein